MKLSKQERIAAVVVLVIIILALGGFLLVKPKVENMLASKSAAEAKEQEYNDDATRAATRKPLRDEILAAYENGSHMADMFFPEMKPYEADNALREFLGQLKSKVVVEDYTIGEPETATLGPVFESEPQVTYDLKTFANQGVEMSAEEAKIAARQASMALYLGEQVTIGASNFSCTISYISPQEMLTFVDEVNNYVKDESGEQVRKAVAIPGYSITYTEVEKKYNDLVTKYNDSIEAEGRAALVKATGMQIAGTTENNNNNAANANGAAGTNNNNANTVEITDNIFHLETSITFYSIERMQDPTAQLDAQDGIVAEDTEGSEEGAEAGTEG